MGESRRYDRFGRYTGKTRHIKDTKPLNGPGAKFISLIILAFVVAKLLGLI